MGNKNKSPLAAARPAPIADASTIREAENKAEVTALAKELAKGFYWRVSLPTQPCVAVECKTESAAIELYNRWAGINGSDHPHVTEQVPKKGPRVYETEDGKILYGASGKEGVASIALPPVDAPNSPVPVEQE